MRWRARVAACHAEFGLDRDTRTPGGNRARFDAAMCDVVEEYRPDAVSFHFGLPERGLLERIRATGAKVFASATTVDEAQWLDAEGCDAIIAQGFEAGGHRGVFFSNDVSPHAGAMALVPPVADAV